MILDYYNLNPRCLYCAERPTVIRVTTGHPPEHGDKPLVATLCEEHSQGERDHFKAEGTATIRD